MPKLTVTDMLAGLTLNPQLPATLQQQIYGFLRDRILAGRLASGTRLPATRTLATSLAVSRNTVLVVYEQLVAEGYCASQVGNGTYVARDIPDDNLSYSQRIYHTKPETIRDAKTRDAHGKEEIAADRLLSMRGEHMLGDRQSATIDTLFSGLFRPGIPALDLFPLRQWQQLLRNACNEVSLGYHEVAGYRPLREAIAAYVNVARDVQCVPEQVIIVNGAQQALNLIAMLLLDAGDSVWIEDPGYPAAAQVMRAYGAHIVPVPVMPNGFSLADALLATDMAKMMYVTPSHQYPTGAIMPVAQRLALLRLAAERSVWIIEDDYDGEFRYTGRPLPALQGLDRSGRVLYIGTFSKVLFPALRLAYLIVPQSLVQPFIRAKGISDRHSPLIEQVALMHFIDDGHFARHLRRMRVIYAGRQQALIDAIHRFLPDVLTLHPSPAGMHLTAWLSTTVPAGFDALLEQRAQSRGILLPALSRYYHGPVRRQGFVLGYANGAPEQITHCIQSLRDLVQYTHRQE